MGAVVPDMIHDLAFEDTEQPGSFCSLSSELVNGTQARDEGFLHDFLSRLNIPQPGQSVSVEGIAVPGHPLRWVESLNTFVD